MTGLLIVFEGLDQSGKETQARRLRQWFEGAGRQVESIAFPDYASPIGQEIRTALHGGRDYLADTIQMLQIANRVELGDEIVGLLFDHRLEDRLPRTRAFDQRWFVAGDGSEHSVKDIRSGDQVPADPDAWNPPACGAGPSGC